MITVKANDKEFLARFKGLIRKFPGATDKAVKDATIYGVQLLKRAAPVKTGSLRRGFMFRRIVEGAWLIYNDIKYALAVDTGYRAHTIRPKRKKMLYWTATGKKRISVSNFEGGKPSRKSKPGFDFYARVVRLPAFRGRHFTERILPALATRLKRLLVVNLRQVAKASGAVNVS